MVVASALGTHPPTKQAPYRNVLRHFNHKGCGETIPRLRQHCVERFGLGNASRKPIEQPSVEAVVCPQPLTYDLDGQLVGHEAAALDVLLNLESERRPPRYRPAKYVPRGYVGDPV